MKRGWLQPAFALLWASETAFDLGAALVSFALGVWIFERTNSPQQFSHAILAAALPALIMTPIAGTLADRFDRRWVIAGCDAASALLIAGLAMLLVRDSLGLVQLYAFNAASAMVAAIRTPAYRAALAAIVPRDRLTQAGGLIGLTRSVLQVGAPLLAGCLMGAAGLMSVIGVEIALVVAGGIAVFGALSRARHAIRGTVRRAGGTTSLGDAVRFLRAVPELAALAVYGAIQESLIMLASSMMIPLVLSSRTSDAVGAILSAGALGGMAGSALLVVAPLRRHLMVWMLVANVGVSLLLLAVGVASSTVLWAACAFGAYFGGAASGACATALLLRTTPAEIRGSVFAVNAALNGVMMCVAMLAGGYLAEHVFEPALASGGAWSDTVGAWVGVGKGRGLGFMFVVCGGLGAALSLLGLASRRFRSFDDADAADSDALPAAPLVI